MVAIAIDVTHATDYPGADKKRNHEVKLGGGPVLGRGATINDGVFHGCAKPPALWESRPPCKRAASQAVPMPTP